MFPFSLRVLPSRDTKNDSAIPLFLPATRHSSYFFVAASQYVKSNSAPRALANYSAVAAIYVR
jgi:hypothetical protein